MPSGPGPAEQGHGDAVEPVGAVAPEVQLVIRCVAVARSARSSSYLLALIRL
jgi:hypothetical protein